MRAGRPSSSPCFRQLRLGAVHGLHALPHVVFAITITLIGYTSVKFAEGLESAAREVAPRPRLVAVPAARHRQRPALMATASPRATSSAHRFPLWPADRYCGHGSAFLHTRSAGRRRPGKDGIHLGEDVGLAPAVQLRDVRGQRQHVALSEGDQDAQGRWR